MVTSWSALKVPVLGLKKGVETCPEAAGLGQETKKKASAKAEVRMPSFFPDFFPTIEFI
jgi:hypothetical protein